MGTFEVVVYNRKVLEARRLRTANHTGLEESWADLHYIPIWAETADDARQRIQHRYPARRGFVVQQVVLLPQL
ncbi:MAG: hypothetical protein K2Q10_12340 [Rhodospirillales bacterium]|nr:hypothetical protein [Rhodospirillales bacterium]